jgi:hypothetical protein
MVNFDIHKKIPTYLIPLPFLFSVDILSLFFLSPFTYSAFSPGKSSSLLFDFLLGVKAGCSEFFSLEGEIIEKTVWDIC